MTTTSLIFKDPIYGIEGTKFFPGSNDEARNWFLYINDNSKNFLEDRNFVEFFLDNPEYWSGAEDMRYEAQGFGKEFDEDYSSRLTDYFIERYTPIAHWTPLELWMSLFYKQLCYQINPYKGALCDIECETYNITRLDYRMDIKEAFLEKNIELAFMLSDAIFNLKDNDNNGPIKNEMFYYLFKFISYNPSQRDKIKEEISGLFQRNPWIFDIPKNKSSLMGFLLVHLAYNEGLLNDLITITENMLKEAVDIYFDTLLFLLTLGFPELDLTSQKDVFVERMLRNLKTESEKEKAKSKEIFQLKEKIKNLENKLAENKKLEELFKSETIEKLIRETTKKTLKNMKRND